MKHLNELHTKYKSKGLIVVAATKEDPGTTNPWLETHGVEYPIFRDDGGATARAYGVRGIPHAVLIGADGRVAYKGSPGGITDRVLEPVLAKCVLRFEYAFPRAFKAVHAKIRKKDFAGAFKALAKVAEKDLTFAGKVRKDLLGYAADMLAQAKADAKAGDYLSAMDTLTRTAKQFKGTDSGKELDALLKEWKKDPEIKKEIKAGKIFAKAKALEKKFLFRNALGAYRQITKRFDGTKTADKAQGCCDRIENGNLWKINPKCKKCTGAGAPCSKHG